VLIENSVVYLKQKKMKAITNIFDPKFDFTAIPSNRRLIAVDKLVQVFKVDNLITYDEYLDILALWVDQVDVAKFRTRVN
jgi:hypothetical protein